MKRLLLLALLMAQTAFAADLTVEIVDRAGRPVHDAVVSLYPARPVPAKPSGTYQVVQHNIQFDPFVLIVPLGADVSFPNRDTVRHQVYSFSPPKTFELKLYARDETHIVHFDKPGIVPLGCNIHDRMTAFIAVVDTAFAVKTGADGVAHLTGVPGGPARLRVWHPYQRTPGGLVEREVFPGNTSAPIRLSMTLRSPPSSFDTY